MQSAFNLFRDSQLIPIKKFVFTSIVDHYGQIIKKCDKPECLVLVFYYTFKEFQLEYLCTFSCKLFFFRRVKGRVIFRSGTIMSEQPPSIPTQIPDSVVMLEDHCNLCQGWTEKLFFQGSNFMCWQNFENKVWCPISKKEKGTFTFYFFLHLLLTGWIEHCSV